MRFAQTYLSRLLGARVALWLLGLGVAVTIASCSRKAPGPPPAPEVLVTEVTQEDVPILDDFVSTLDGSVNASIQARVQGYLTSQNYKEGTAVKKGDLLFQIDPRPFEAALAQAKAALAQAEATQRQADLAAARNLELFKTRAISELERDNAVQASAAAKAQVEAQRAAVEQAQLNREFTSITSPIDGIAGLAKTQVGDLVGPSTGALTSVATVDPIKAYFTVSDQRYTTYSQRWADPAQRAEHEKQLQFELILSDGSHFPHKGELFAAENQVDLRTGSVRIAAIFPNPGNILRPGQFARISLRTDVRQGALLLPQRAVIELQGSYQVAIVGPENKVHIQPVKVGRRFGQMWIVEEGVHAGDRVVVEGVQKARDGVLVSPKPWHPPAATPAPGTK
ncbi:MAG TPA: efflux RND transporter periplasmic adaptor subunit [Chthoniobacterales bacterium]|nr:efflux RND transporter periplasmic adaptor subunit [Chthoniobacterales bacterium]